MRVLIAEDDAHVRSLVEVALEEHELIPVADGVAAMSVLEGEGFDAAVIDVMMPEVDGLAVTRAIRRDERRSGVPIVLLTARVGEDDHIKGFEAGADRYLTKPFQPEHLAEVLDDLADTPADERERQRDEQLAQARLLRRLETRF